MISYELKPTFDNLKNSILTDSVGRNKSIAKFIELLDEIDGNVAIALDDSWGNGKTFFVKQTQIVLQNRTSSDEKLNGIRQCMEKLLKNDKVRNYLPVYYDAWSNDNDTDPVLSIIFNMLQDVDDLEDYEVNDKNWWDRFTTGLELITTSFGGPRVQAFLDSVKGKDVLSEIKKRKQSDQVLNQLFDTLLEKQPADTRILFFIDEIDRCCPNFAVRLLERIKHYFLHEKVIFVVSVNMSELQHTIKRHYGNDFNADKYLRRFFDFTIPLPPADMTKYYETINFEDNKAKDEIAKVVMRKYNFSLREITRYLQYLKVAVPERYITYGDHKYPFYVEILTPFLIGLKVHDSDKYNDFINGKDISSFVEIMQECRADSFCEILINPGKETFNKENTAQKTFVSLDERFKPMYECLFGYNDSAKAVRIPGDTIYANDKNYILEIMSMMRASQNLKGGNNGTN